MEILRLDWPFFWLRAIGLPEELENIPARIVIGEERRELQECDLYRGEDAFARGECVAVFREGECIAVAPEFQGFHDGRRGMVAELAMFA